MNPGFRNSNPSFFTVFRSALFFAAATHATGVELFKLTDRDLYRVPQLVKDIKPGPGSSSPHGLIVMNDVLYMAAEDAVNGRVLYGLVTSTGISDPYVEASPTLVMYGYFHTAPEGITAYRDSVLLYSAHGQDVGIELFSLNTSAHTDPAQNGAALVKDVYPGVSASEPQWITPTSH